MAGRFLPQRDLNVFERVNKELIGDLQHGKEGIINQEVVLYKVSVQDTKTNMYGEAQGGKKWKDGIKFACLVDAEDFDYNNDEFGADEQQNATFNILRQTLIDLSVVPENNWAVTCNAYRVRFSSLNLERIRSI